MNKILLAENDISLQNTLRNYLQTSGHQVLVVSSLDRLSQLISNHNFDLLILDRFLNDGDLYTYLPYLSLNQLKARSLIISQNNDLEHKIKGFDLAVNDFLPKPFSLDEFHLRVLNLLSLEKIYQAEQINIGALTYYPETGLLEVSNKQSIFCPKEKILFDCLYRNRQRIVNRDYLINSVWGNTLLPKENTLDVYIRRIRQKLFTYGHKLETIRTIGYRLYL